MPHFENKNFSSTAGLKILFAAMSGFMLVLAIATSLASNLFALPEAVVKEPWFLTTLVDFYFNLTILSAWVIYKEKRLWPAVLWILGFVLLGSIVTCLYVLLQLLRLKPGEGLEKVLLRADSSSRKSAN